MTDHLGREGSESGGDYLGREPAPADPPQTVTEFAEQRDDLPEEEQARMFGDGDGDEKRPEPSQE